MSTAMKAAEQKPQMTIHQLLNHPKFKDDIAKSIPNHCNPDRMLLVALNSIRRTPKLAECTQVSFIKSMMELTQWGLEPDGRRAHLIPYRNNRENCVECQLIIDYKGYVELAYRTGVVKNLHADVVHAGDVFRYSKGKLLEHVPWFLRTDAGKPKEQGEIIAVYCLAELDGGLEKVEVLPKADVDAIRKRSKAAMSGPWVTDWNEMAKKTAFRRLSKWLPLSAEIIDAFDADADRLDLPAVPVANKLVAPADDLMALITDGSNVIDADSKTSNVEPSGDAGQPTTPGQNASQDTPEGSIGGDEEHDPYLDLRNEFANCSTLKDAEETFEANDRSDLSEEAAAVLKECYDATVARIRGARGPRSNKQGNLLDTGSPSAQ